MTTRRITLDSDSAEKESDPNVTYNDDGTLIYTLRFPVVVKYRQGSQEREDHIRELVFRRVNGADLRHVSKLKEEMEIMVQLFIRLANVNAAVFDQLDGEDIEKAMAAISDFLPGARKTGKTT